MRVKQFAKGKFDAFIPLRQMLRAHDPHNLRFLDFCFLLLSALLNQWWHSVFDEPIDDDVDVVRLHLVIGRFAEGFEGELARGIGVQKRYSEEAAKGAHSDKGRVRVG